MKLNRKELTLVEPVYATLNCQAYATALIHSNESIRNWCFNDVIMLKCSKRFLSGYSSPEVEIKGSTWIDCPYLEKQWYGLRFVDGHINYVIKRMIDNGYYVCYAGVDDYYLEGKSWYKKRHFRHDGLIYGYDTDKKIYMVYAYDSQWQLKGIEISFESFEKGRRYGVKDEEYGFVCGIKPNDEIVEFDVTAAFKGMSDYLECINKKKEQDRGDVYGPDVHKYLAAYVDKLYDGSIPYEKMDYRVFRMLWEHKKVMLGRLILAEKALKMKNSSSSLYSDIVRQADTVRMLYASHHLKRRDSVLPVISKKLIELNQNEISILRAFIKKVRRKLDNGTVEIH